jgi:hypothetical protein
MTCPSFQLSADGRKGIGVNQPQSGLDYPLVAPSEDIRYLLADAYLTYDDPAFYSTSATAVQHPLRIKWLYGVGCETSSAPGWAPTPTHAADILIVDANNNTVFNSTQLVPLNGDATYQSFAKRAWGDDYDIYEWIGNNAVCRIVVYKTWPAEFQVEPQHWPTHIVPTNAVLDERAVHKMPKRLRSMRFVDNGATIGTARRSHVIFAGGSNMALASSPVNSTTSSRAATNVLFDATPGNGTGQYSDCGDELGPPIYRINGVVPNAYGDFLISAADCLWLRQPTAIANGRATPTAHTLSFGSDCGPCCDCSDYVDVAKYMNSIQAKYAQIGSRTNTIKLLHEGNIDRWLEQRDCRLQKPLRVLLTPQYCPVIDVVLMYCNQCLPCANEPELSATFSVFPNTATAEVVCGYTTMYAPGVPGRAITIAGTWPTFTVKFPPLTLGNSAYVKFRLKFTPRTAAYAVTASLTGTVDGAAIYPNCGTSGTPATALDTQLLNCEPDGTTTTNC